MADARNSNGTFAKNVSGNPNGRPRNKPPRQRIPETLRNIFFEIGEERVTMAGPNGPMEMSMIQAAMRAMYRDAIKGKSSAQRLILGHLTAASRVNGDLNEITRMFYEENTELQAEVARLQALVPPRQTHGVLVVPPRPGSVLYEPPETVPDGEPEND